MHATLFNKLVKTRRLPTPSATALNILEMADREDASLVEVADVMAADPAISSRILKFANSADFGASGEITTLRQAVTRLGLRAIKVTALSFSLMNERDSAQCPGFDPNLFWANSLANAVATKMLIPNGSAANPEEGFVGGLLSRLGKLVFAVGAPEEYAVVLAKAGSVLETTVEDEHEALGTDHVEIACALFERWKLPAVFIKAIRGNSDEVEAAGAEVSCLAKAIAAGQQIGDCLCGVPTSAEAILRHADAGLQLPADKEALGPWLEQVREVFRETAQSMSVSLSDVPDPYELQSRAADLIAELSIVGEAENQAMLAQNRVLEQKATTDTLTGLNNRAAFDARLESEIERLRRYGRPFALLMLDVDHFKRFNDTYGHLVGDDVLKLVARACSDIVRTADFAARYGGEEFAVIAPEIDSKQAALFAERLRAAIEGRTYDYNGQSLNVTVSIGVAAVSSECQTFESKPIIHAADAALYQAKKSGRNRCCCAALTKRTSPDAVQPV
ncbi:MAG: GGDEF domain-containing protein [Planctomycetota bacterium]|nr:GGDEF domain-containing protein [Planctomycetota bacterium]